VQLTNDDSQTDTLTVPQERCGDPAYIQWITASGTWMQEWVYRCGMRKSCSCVSWKH